MRTTMTMAHVLMMACAVTMTGCWSAEDPTALEQKPAETRLFTFHVKGDFETCYEDMTRASVRLEDNNTAGITDVWVLDYQEDILVQVVHQAQGDEGFGHPQMAMTYGQHSVKLIASKGDNPVLTVAAGSTSASMSGGHRLEWTKVKDTFVLDYPVEVTASSNGTRAPELQRAVAAVTLIIADEVPADAKLISITMNRSLILALPGLTSGAVSEGTVTLYVPESWKGQTGKSLSVYTLNTGTDMVTDVTVTVLDDSNGMLAEVTIEDVPVKRNQQTTMRGNVFASSEGFGIKVNTEWGEGIEVEF